MRDVGKFHKLVICDTESEKLNHALVQKLDVTSEELQKAVVFYRIKKNFPKFIFDFNSLEFNDNTRIWSINGKLIDEPDSED